MLVRNCSRPASSPARSQSCQNRTNLRTKFGSWRSFAPERQCFSGLSLSTCALGQTQRKRKWNACNTGSGKLAFCLEIRACQPLRLGYSKSFGLHRQRHGKQFSNKLLSVCIPHIFLLHLKRRPCESVVPQVHLLGERLRAPGVCRCFPCPAQIPNRFTVLAGEQVIFRLLAPAKLCDKKRHSSVSATIRPSPFFVSPECKQTVLLSRSTCEQRIPVRFS